MPDFYSQIPEIEFLYFIRENEILIEKLYFSETNWIPWSFIFRIFRALK